MKILVIGGGGREHAIAWRLAKTPGVRLYAMPGNPGMARLAHCIPNLALTPESILAAATNFGVDLTVIGPEAPLVDGVVDLFQASNHAIVGCTAAAARLEGSKIHAKAFFAEHAIPTARFRITNSQQEVSDALQDFLYPVVIKADGLASGKGVVIASTQAEADQAVVQLGSSLVIEEFLEGKEISFIVLSDGKTVLPFLPSRDHKRAYDGDQGPNTGGMGAYCDTELLTADQIGCIMNQIILPTVKATAFTGFLYAGLMMTATGPKLLEYNVRLGDPEAQALMHHFDADLPELLFAAAEKRLSSNLVRWVNGVSHCVVVAASGYPGTVRTGDPISGIVETEATGATVFHAGTRAGWSGYSTAGGRVLAVTTAGSTLTEAAQNTYKALKHIKFSGMHFRTDIGSNQNRYDT